MKCPKCSYIRSQTDLAPDWQCPSCGIAYVKFKSTKEDFDGSDNTEREDITKIGNEGLIILSVIGFLVIQFDNLFGVMLPCSSIYRSCMEVTKEATPFLYSVVYNGLTLLAVGVFCYSFIRMIRDK